MNPEIEKFVKNITECDENAVLKLASPTNNREEMGEVYVGTLGYNPITYFDEADINQELTKIMSSLDSKDRDLVGRHRKDIVSDALMEINENRPEHISRSTVNALKSYVDIDNEDDWYIGEDISVDDEVNSADMWSDDINDDDSDEE